MRAPLAALLLTSCSGLNVQLHRAAVQKPSNVALYFSVETRGGEPVPGLSAESFQIYEDGRLVSPFESKQTILNPEVAVVHYTLLLLDLSGSIVESGSLPLLQEHAASFAGDVTQLHHIGVAGFDGRAEVIPLVGFTTNSNAVKSSLGRLSGFRPKDPSTNLNGAVVAAIDVLEKELEHSKQPVRFATLVIFTDGTDRAHRVSEREMLDRVEQSRVNVFVIGVGGEIDLDQLSKMSTAGFVTAQDMATVGAAFDRVAALIEASAHKFYLLSYCSPARAGVHELKVVANANETSGELTHTFNADGFGPNCDPNKRPSFPIGKVRLPAG
jgi:hypothetical protein